MMESTNRRLHIPVPSNGAITRHRKDTPYQLPVELDCATGGDPGPGFGVYSAAG